MALSMEVSLKAGGGCGYRAGKYKRVIKRAWALLEDEPE